ncbi:hypothetical protein JET72_05110 [Pseudomonas juntendi]|uniref:hypothetical protein n=1 Tax=Pseudomonas juntendi TaxID=2666183 RepID=UPI0018E694A0|nr:hypothetical protein [Pseudomonas juntendi]MBI6913283.1 hypothetical protein [Pseudomonas juntendi]
MLYGQSVKLEGVSFGNPSLPRIRDFQALIANHPNCVGAWRLDGADAIVYDADGAIQSFANWKTGGLPLVAAGGTPARLVDNTLNGGKAARFTAATEYRLNGYALDLGKAYTMVAVFKPDTYSSIMNVCGDILASDMTKTASIFSRRNGTAAAAAFFEATDTVYQNVASESVFQPVIARHDASAKVNYLTVPGTGSTNKTSPGTATGTVIFKLSDLAQYSFLGLLDFVALFDINTAADTALQTALADYLVIRARPA